MGEYRISGKNGGGGGGVRVTIKYKKHGNFARTCDSPPPLFMKFGGQDPQDPPPPGPPLDPGHYVRSLQCRIYILVRREMVRKES